MIVVGKVVDDTYYCGEFEEKSVLYIPKGKVYMSCTMLILKGEGVSKPLRVF